MYSTILKTMALASILITSAVAVPGAKTEARSIKLDNGKESVEVIDTTLSSRSEAKNLLMTRQSNINCKGSAFCERLAGSCDDAFRKVIATNEYSTFQG
jgi:hypothetical protein